MKDNEKVLLVRPLKTWFSAFMPFTYQITESLYGQPVMETDLAPDVPGNPKAAVWNYLKQVFAQGEWFSLGSIVLSEINPPVSIWQVKRILGDFVKSGKLQKKGTTRDTEYSLE